MAYDVDLAERVREALGSERDLGEIKMMGGLCFMVEGHMAVGILGDRLMVRVGPERYRRALKRRHARVWDFTGRPLTGFVQVEPAGIATRRSLASWVAPARAFVRTLPAKRQRKWERDMA
jgi:hypothetical protein